MMTSLMMMIIIITIPTFDDWANSSLTLVAERQSGIEVLVLKG